MKSAQINEIRTVRPAALSTRLEMFLPFTSIFFFSSSSLYLFSLSFSLHSFFPIYLVFFVVFLVRNLRLWTWWWWRCTRPLLMMTLSSLSCAWPQKTKNEGIKIQAKRTNKSKREQNKTKKKMKINSFLFLFLFSLRVSLDPSMSSSYDSSTGLSRQLVRLQCPDIRWAHTKKMKMKILFI